MHGVLARMLCVKQYYSLYIHKRVPSVKNVMAIFFFLFACPILSALGQSIPRRPHIVLMVADDLGWNDVSFHGFKQIPTPNIDSIARDGIILNQYYVQPICSPSRAVLMTAKYAVQIGFQHRLINAAAPWGLPLKEKILPQYLKDLNYTTHAVGKWHLGFFEKDYLPTRRGFDSFFGYYTGVEDYYTHEDLEDGMIGLDLHDEEENAWQYYGTYGPDLFTEKAKEIILEHNPSEPLFLYLAQQAPHSGNFDDVPLQAPEKYVAPMVGIEDEKRRIFAGMLSSMDHSAGEVFEALEVTGMLDNTIFIFTSDNGGSPQEQDGTSGSNWPLKGCKHTLWEGGVRAVSFVWSPNVRLRSGIYNELMHISDWLPTLLSAVGGQDALKMLPKNINGVDQWPSLVHGVRSPRTEILLNLDEYDKAESIRIGRYKLIKGAYKGGKFDKWYDKEGKISNVSCNQQIYNDVVYRENYMRFLSDSKAANILWNKYGRDPILTTSCFSQACENFLEVKCSNPQNLPTTCNATKESCLFDIINDPCEIHNIAKELPRLVTEMEQAIDKYREIAVPDGSRPSDPAADPKYHGNAWVPWR